MIPVVRTTVNETNTFSHAIASQSPCEHISVMPLWKFSYLRRIASLAAAVIQYSTESAHRAASCRAWLARAAASPQPAWSRHLLWPCLLLIRQFKGRNREVIISAPTIGNGGLLNGTLREHNGKPYAHAGVLNVTVLNLVGNDCTQRNGAKIRPFARLRVIQSVSLGRSRSLGA